MFAARFAPNPAPPLAIAEDEEDEDFVIIPSPGDQDAPLDCAPPTSEPAPLLFAAAADVALVAPIAGAATARVVRSTHRGRGGVRGDYSMEAESENSTAGGGKSYDARCPGWFH